MYLHVYIPIVVLIWNGSCVISKTIQKRQLYREQVSPHLGGKIPDTAFHTDRLALNQLQKAGIAIPDGVILEQRNPEVYQYAHKTKRPVYKVPITKDHRYTLNEGRYETAASVETTYVIPQITQLQEHDLINIIRPTEKAFTLPNPYHKGQSRISTFNNVHQTIDLYKYRPYKNYNLDFNLVYQPSNFYGVYSRENYIGSSIFYDLTSFFDSYVHH